MYNTSSYTSCLVGIGYSIILTLYGVIMQYVFYQVSTVFLLLSLVGWITFGVGFGFRNFEYSKHDDLSRAALYPEFICLWIFGISFPILFVMTIIDLFCAYRLTTSIVSNT